jgi:molecular chaperone GrpE (heat shock protein)
MVAPVPQDTPIHRATLSELSVEQIEALVESMRERRMRSYTAYQLAQEAKKKMKEEKDKLRYEKILTMFQKKLDSVDKALDTMSKYLNEMKVMELVLGD